MSLIGGAYMTNKKARIQLINIYGHQCFLGGVVLVKNPLTVHHIVPQRVRKDNRLDNLALLCHLEHQVFNTIEMYNKYHAQELNYGFREYKHTFNSLLITQMRTFAYEHINALGYTIDYGGKMLKLKRG